MLKLTPLSWPDRTPLSGRRACHDDRADGGTVNDPGDHQHRHVVGDQEHAEPDDHRHQGAEQDRFATDDVGDLARHQHRAQCGDGVDGEDQGGGQRGEVPLLLVHPVQRGGQAGHAKRDTAQDEQKGVGPALRVIGEPLGCDHCHVPS
jgi:hypothetical protein